MALLLAGSIVQQHSGIQSVGLLLVSLTEAYAVTWLIRRVVGPTFLLDRVWHVWMLIVSAACVPLVGALPAMAILGPAGTDTFASVLGWWFSQMLGILLIAPVIIGVVAYRNRLATALGPWRALEMPIAFVGIAVMTDIVFGGVQTPLVGMPAYLLPFLLWAVFRFGPGGSAMTVLVVWLIGLWNTSKGLGPFALNATSSLEWTLRGQGAIAVAAVSMLLLSSVIAERRRIARENASLILELQQALAEIKTLRGFIPICAWCHKVRNDAGYWQQIESYLHSHTEATFSHGICPVCEAIAHEEIDGQRASTKPN